MAESMNCHLLGIRIQFDGILHKQVAIRVVIAIKMHGTDTQWAKQPGPNDMFET